MSLEWEAYHLGVYIDRRTAIKSMTYEGDPGKKAGFLLLFAKHLRVLLLEESVASRRDFYRINGITNK